jgi:hypothetical protein
MLVGLIRASITPNQAGTFLGLAWRDGQTMQLELITCIADIDKSENPSLEFGFHPQQRLLFHPSAISEMTSGNFLVIFQFG